MPDRPRPIIGFLTDFGFDGAAAICRGVMLSIARDAQIVDISHAVRKYAIRDGAYLLATAVPWLPVGVHVAVVDPGVGTARRPIGIRTARGDVLIGPDNGLLLRAAERLGGIDEARVLENRELMLPDVSSTFHGRDVFAPVAARLALGEPFESVGPVVDPAELMSLPRAAAVVEPGRVRTAVEYVDSFGNLRLTATAADLRAALGPIDDGGTVALAVGAGAAASSDGTTRSVRWSRTFGESPVGALVLYEDSSGRLAIAEVEGSASRVLAAEAETAIGIIRG